MKENRLFYTAPASDWNEALPLGNGRLGMMVYGGPVEERVQLNEETFWSGWEYPEYDSPETKAHLGEMRELIFRNFAASDNYGMIFTMMMDFDLPSEWAYLEHIREIFAPYGTEFYYVELIAPQAIRLQRNATENRLKHKPSKRDLAFSNQRVIEDDRNHRCVSHEGEIKFDNYLRIENSDKPADVVARMIQERFGL